MFGLAAAAVRNDGDREATTAGVEATAGREEVNAGAVLWEAVEALQGGCRAAAATMLVVGLSARGML